MRYSWIVSWWLPEITRVRGAVQWVTLAQVLQSKSRTVLGSAKVSMGMLDCLAKSQPKKLSSAPSPIYTKDLTQNRNAFRGPPTTEGYSPPPQLGHTTKRCPSLQVEVTVNGQPIKVVIDTDASSQVSPQLLRYPRSSIVSNKHHYCICNKGPSLHKGTVAFPEKHTKPPHS